MILLLLAGSEMDSINQRVESDRFETKFDPDKSRNH